MTENEITELIIGAAIEVHKELGPGLFESVYEICLFYELHKLGLSVERQVSLPVTYKELELESGFKIDLLINGKVIVELKSIKELGEIHFAQTLTYLRLSECSVGLLINFNEKLLKNGIRRIVNNY